MQVCTVKKRKTSNIRAKNKRKLISYLKKVHAIIVVLATFFFSQ